MHLCAAQDPKQQHGTHDPHAVDRRVLAAAVSAGRPDAGTRRHRFVPRPRQQQDPHQACDRPAGRCDRVRRAGERVPQRRTAGGTLPAGAAGHLRAEGAVHGAGGLGDNRESSADSRFKNTTYMQITGIYAKELFSFYAPIFFLGSKY